LIPPKSWINITHQSNLSRQLDLGRCSWWAVCIVSHQPHLKKKCEQKEKTHDWPVDVDLDSWVAGAVGTWEGDQGARVSTTAASDVDLTARDVELGTTGTRGAVQTDLLTTDEVLAAGSRGRNGEGDGLGG
jgi:hypothetical protein